ncbi:MAG: hypothetical protein H3C43_07680, partial [Leptonema sp. (in: Bacteria)]|nr:hypothetical protein [Leptonema sp. (in: bacteria)]
EPDYYTVNRRSNHNGDLYPPELIIKDQVFPVSFSHHGKHLLTTLALQNNDATNTRIQTIVRTKWLNHRIDQKNRLVFILPTEF